MFFTKTKSDESRYSLNRMIKYNNEHPKRREAELRAFKKAPKRQMVVDNFFINVL